MDFTKATIEELEVVAYEDEYSGVMDKALAVCQLMHRQMDLFEVI